MHCIYCNKDVDEIDEEGVGLSCCKGKDDEEKRY